MKIDFVSAEPKAKARPFLDAMLSQGVDQVAIACAFVTAGGAQVIRRHASNLKKIDSFLVAAWEYPTDEAALSELHALAPGNIYVHLGSQTPVEKKVGRGLMHSKVFFARRGYSCWLWVGSHNLTASAMQGANHEAAIVLSGTIDEAPFQDALAHLEDIKSKSVKFDPLSLPPQTAPDTTLVVHAEQGANLIADVPWHVHLLPMTTDFDSVMRPPGNVWLYLYPKGSLSPGRSRPRAIAAYSGTITALNFTEHHPRRGIAADWQQATYIIEQRGAVFVMSERSSPSVSPSQCVFRIEAEEDPGAVWLAANPAPKEEKVVGEVVTVPIDLDLEDFFTRKSVAGGRLVHREYRRLRRSIKVTEKEAGAESPDELARRLKVPDGTEIDVVKNRDDDRFLFIYRARYRS